MSFTTLALHGFGGVLPWAQRTLVEEKQWLTREEFVELLAFSQLLPGPNVCNLSIMVGDKYFGWRGAWVALAGMLLAPAVLVLLMAVSYAQFADHPVVRRAMTGMAAVAAGLILATATKLALTYRRRWRWLVFGVAALITVGVLRVPLPWVLLTLAPIAIVAAWWAERT